jgi:hypothetical protein
LDYLNFHPSIHFSSEIPRSGGDKNQRVIEICKHFEGVKILYDGKKAQNFIDTTLFKENGLDVIFQDYQHTPYPQLWGDFEPYMSTIDLLMNHGPEARSILMSSPLPEILRKSL